MTKKTLFLWKGVFGAKGKNMMDFVYFYGRNMSVSIGLRDE